MNDSFDKSPQKKLGTGPKTRVCYVCGRLYGLHSFDIHLKQCKELWIAREAEKDPRERKKLPEDPALKLGIALDGSTEGLPSAKDLEEINKLSTVAFNTEALDTCAYCGRTFLPEKLLIHNKSCTSENPARKLTDGVKRGGGASNTPAQTPTKSSSEANTTPIRPSSITRPKSSSSKIRNSIESTEQDDTTHLRVDDGNLVGHLGGPSGRSLRKTNSPGMASPTRTDSRPTSQQQQQQQQLESNTNTNAINTNQQQRNVFTISDFQDKEEVVEYLQTKLDSLETIAMELARSIIEIRSVVDSLR